MNKLFKVMIYVFFFIAPILLGNFVNEMANFMRFDSGSPLVSGYNYMRWSHVYLTAGIYFCACLYIPVILAIIRKRQKILLIPFFSIIGFVVFTFIFVNISKDVYAKQQIEKAGQELVKNPKNSQAIGRQAIAYKKMGQFNKAVELYTQALKITPNPAYVFHDRAMSYTELREFNKAFEDFNKAMSLRPNQKEFIAQCYNDRGVAYYKSGQYEKSCDDVKKAIEMGYQVHPGFVAALKQEGFDL